MIRVRLTDPNTRDAIATSLRFANLVVTIPVTEDTLDVDFAAFDLADDVQLRIVNLMIAAWNRERGGTGNGLADVTIVSPRETVADKGEPFTDT